MSGLPRPIAIDTLTILDCVRVCGIHAEWISGASVLLFQLKSGSDRNLQVPLPEQPWFEPASLRALLL